MIKLFDYIFFRVYKQYKKWREDYPYPFAEGVIVVIQGFLICDILTVLSIFGLFPRKIENPKYYALILVLILYIINHRRYSNKHIEILNAYDCKVDVYKRRNGIIIVIFIIVIIAFPLVVGALRNNLGYNI